MGAQEESTLHELTSFAREVADRARAFAADVEVLVTRRDLASFGIENRALSPELKLGRLQVGLRAIRDGRLAVAASTSFSVDENVSALKAALSSGRPTKLEGFSPHRLEPSLRGFDDALARFLREPQALQALAVDVRDRAFAEAAARRHVETIEGRALVQSKWTAVATGSGLASALENVLSVSAEVNSARSEREVLRSWPRDESVVRGVGARAVREFPEKTLTPEELGLGPAAKVQAILDPELVEALLRYPAHDKFLASSFVSGQSTLKAGEKIAGERIRLVDTGRPHELARDFDDEGVPRSETVLIEAGAFGRYVTSRTSAALAGFAETGNGVRHPVLAEDLNEAPVRDKLLGLAMDPGTRTTAELMASQDLAILPRSLLGIHGADRARTAFSATVADGVAIRNGKVVGQLAPGRWNVSGRVLPGDGEEGLLQGAEPSRDRVFTGSALLPALLVTLTAG